MKHRVSHLVEYGLLRVIAFIFLWLPYRVALSFAWIVALFLYLVGRRRVREARRRIREVFGDAMPEHAVRRAAWISLRNLCFNAVEVIRTPRMTLRWLDCHVERGNLREVLKRHLSGGKGCIFVVPHMGNWDLAGTGLALEGVPVFAVAARQKNVLADDWLNRLRAGQGMEVIMRDDHVIRRVLRNLKEGKALAFLTDLRSRTPGIRAQFLGKEANLVAGLGLFARQAGVPVLPAYVRRDGWGRHVWHVEEPIFPSPELEKAEDWQRITQQVMNLFDAAIRRYPDQYFWYNKRWVLDPLVEAGEVAGGR